jgi:hypothetical protein
VIGLFLPVLQGILFLVLGFALLSAESRWVKDKVDFFISRYPRLAARLKTARKTAAVKWW